MGAQRRHIAFVLGLASWTLASVATAQQDCSTVGQNTFVRDTLREHYLWYRELPDPDPALFPSPAAYLEAVRYRPLDTSFSYVADRAASDAFFTEAQFTGFGFTSTFTGPREVRLAQVFADSPADEAGMRRGDTLVAVNGQPVAELIEAGRLFESFGPDRPGTRVALAWRTVSGRLRAAILVKRTVTIPTVTDVGAIDVAGRRVGYFQFRSFVIPSYAALEAAFEELRRLDVQDLVLDLRYNGGGLIEVARYLGSLIGGFATDGRVFVELRHNDRNTASDEARLFDDPPEALDASRVVVVATRATASASEVVVNALRPFLPVAIVGGRTYGKPVGQYGFAFCDKVLFPVAFQLTNARGEGDYFGGFPPDCPAPDDLDHPLGDPAERSLAEALSLLGTGRCTPPAAGAAAARDASTARRGPEPGTDPWRRLLGAF